MRSVRTGSSAISGSCPRAEHKPTAFLRTEFNEDEGRFSPDARWVVYVSDRSGKPEIYELPFDESNPGSPASGGLRQISTEGGDNPHWRADGKEIFYMAPDGYLMSVEVNVAGGVFQPGAPQRLFKSPATAYGTWDVSADGKKFLIAAPAGSASPGFKLRRELGPVSCGPELDRDAEAVTNGAEVGDYRRYVSRR